MNSINAQQVIEALKLIPLPQEGGFYKETYRSTMTLPGEVIGYPSGGHRPAGTAIFYMVTEQSFSSLHRLKHDEIFHFYLGDEAEMLQIFPDGSHLLINIGADILSGQQLQVHVPAGVWQATKLRRGGRFALFGTTMAPGFDFRDFEMANPGELKRQFPQLSGLVDGFTHVSE